MNAPCREKIWCEAGVEFGSDRGKVLKVIKALYGLKSYGESWQKMLATSLGDLGYFASKVDPDLWLCPRTKPNR